MSMSPALKAALQARHVTVAWLVKMELPGKTIRLTDGSGFVIIGTGDDAEIYTGKDPVFGKLAEIGEIIETEGSEAPRQTIHLLPQGNAALAELTAPSAQGAPVSIFLAAIDARTGFVIGEPDRRFTGFLDDAGFLSGRNSALLEVELATAWEWLFDDNEGHRWNDEFWTYLYGPQARAFEHVVNVGEQVYWGYNGPSSGSGGSSGGGNGSIGGGLIGAIKQHR